MTAFSDWPANVPEPTYPSHRVFIDAGYDDLVRVLRQFGASPVEFLPFAHGGGLIKLRVPPYHPPDDEGAQLILRGEFHWRDEGGLSKVSDFPAVSLHFLRIHGTRTQLTVGWLGIELLTRYVGAILEYLAEAYENVGPQIPHWLKVNWGIPKLGTTGDATTVAKDGVPTTRLDPSKPGPSASTHNKEGRCTKRKGPPRLEEKGEDELEDRAQKVREYQSLYPKMTREQAATKAGASRHSLERWAKLPLIRERLRNKPGNK